MSMMVIKSAVITGPIINPIIPKTLIPPKVEKKMIKSCILAS